MNNITHIYNANIANKESIKSSQSIEISQLYQVPNGSIENIFCDCLDSLDFNKRQEIENELIKKIMLGGEIYLRILNYRILAQKIIKDSIDMSEINNILPNTNSMTDNLYIDNLIGNYSSKLKILKMDIDNLYYNIVMKRIS